MKLCSSKMDKSSTVGEVIVLLLYYSIINNIIPCHEVATSCYCESEVWGLSWLVVSTELCNINLHKHGTRIFRWATCSHILIYKQTISRGPWDSREILNPIRLHFNWCEAALLNYCKLQSLQVFEYSSLWISFQIVWKVRMRTRCKQRMCFCVIIDLED